MRPSCCLKVARTHKKEEEEEENPLSITFCKYLD
jgi:hypothetical protein